MERGCVAEEPEGEDTSRVAAGAAPAGSGARSRRQSPCLNSRAGFLGNTATALFLALSNPRLRYTGPMRLLIFCRFLALLCASPLFLTGCALGGDDSQTPDGGAPDAGSADTPFARELIFRSQLGPHQRHAYAQPGAAPC